jgi:hypothetical protein
MNYSVYSFVALRPLREQGQQTPSGEPGRESQPGAALKFMGSATISAARPNGAWYVRLYRRFFGPPRPRATSRFDFELTFNSPADVRAQLGIDPNAEGAVIEILLTRTTT